MLHSPDPSPRTKWGDKVLLTKLVFAKHRQYTQAENAAA